MEKQEKNIKRGKKARASGGRFELKIHKDLEKKGWIVIKNPNNVGMWDEKGNQVIKKKNKYIIQKTKKEIKFEEIIFDKLIQAKHKFRGKGIPMMLGSGMPDFIAFKRLTFKINKSSSLYNYLKDVIKVWEKREPIEDERFTHPTFTKVIGVECKGGDDKHKYLDKEEKEKAKWLIKNKIFSTFFIANKGKKRGEIIYKEFS